MDADAGETAFSPGRNPAGSRQMPMAGMTVHPAPCGMSVAPDGDRFRFVASLKAVRDHEPRRTPIPGW